MPTQVATQAASRTASNQQLSILDLTVNFLWYTVIYPIQLFCSFIFWAYLLCYYLTSAIAWYHILFNTLSHLSNREGNSDAFHISGAPTALSFLSFAFSTTPLPRVLRFLGLAPTTLEWRLPPNLQPIYRRATTTYARGVGLDTALCQTFAILFEIMHASMGLVESPSRTTVMEMSSRLFLVWGIAEQFPEVRSNPLYTTMVLAWSVTAAARYWFHAINLVGVNSRIFRYPLYTLSYILYPVGVLSEAFLIYATLPESSPIPGRQSWFYGIWTPADYIRGALFILWLPCIAYMIVQRHKVLHE